MVGRVRIDLGHVPPDLPLPPAPADPVEDRTRRGNVRGRALRAHEAGVRLVRDQCRELPVDLRKPRLPLHLVPLDLLHRRDLHPGRRGGAGLRDAADPPAPEGAAPARRGPYPGAARAVLLGALLVALTAVPSYLAAQDAPTPCGLGLGAEREHDLRGTGPLLYRDARYIVIHLRKHRLSLFEGPRVIWTATAASGTGFVLEGGGGGWKFATPRGVFWIQHMEKA